MSRSEAPFRRTLDVRLHENGDALRAALNEAGCAVTPFGMGGPRSSVPDAYVCDLRGSDRPLGLVNRARQAAGATPLILVVGTDPLSALADAAERHVMVQLEHDPAPLIRALGRAVRSADLAREAGLRVTAMTALALPLARDHAAPLGQNVALLAEPAPLALETFHAIETDFGCSGVLTRAQALRALERGDSGALVIAPSKERRDAAALVRLIRRQSVLRDVPVVIVERRRTPRHVAFWMRVGADGVFLPDEGALIGSAIRSGLKRREVDTRLHSFLTRTVTSDAGAESRIAGTRLFDAALTERCRRGAAPFCVGAVRLRAPDGSAPGPAALSEAAVYLSFGVGGEDLMCRPTPDLFLFQLVSADQRGAERTVRGLATLVGDLKFGDDGVFATFTGEAAACAWREGEAPEELVGRTINGLRRSEARVEELV